MSMHYAHSGKTLNADSMHRLYHFARQEFRHISRDQMLFLFMMAPLVLFAFVHWAVPALEHAFPVITGYYPYISMFGAMQTSIMMGFISAFILLEEKDEEVIQALRILPLRASTFLTYRLTGATLLATVGAWLIIRWGGLVPVREVPAILLATQFGLLAPLISLVVSTFARNKIEGLAYFKILDLIILLPMVSFFFPGWWTWLLAVVPVFWSFHAYESAIHGSHFALWMLTGFLVYALAMRILGHWFRKKVWNGL